MELDLPDGATVSELKNLLALHLPDLQPALPSALVSINREFAFATDPVPAGAEVGLFPPVSGGAPDAHSELLPTHLHITAAPIDLDALTASITLPSTGAVCLFTGIVRASTQRGHAPHTTAHLHYEAYTQMAEQKLQQVADEIRTRWPAVEGIAIVQRVGTLLPGTPTVLIACSAAHRDTGVFEAARYGIDRLKQIVPVWKKEVGPDGEQWLEGSYIPARAD
ncbi:MAG: putative molybdenum cofactor biosynthesis protein [Chloroflexota bacterium]